ncbi:MAG: hypothetical protein QOD56_1641 [Gammaproteobacteria bacterium]|jgi:hypothetical protein|nr:hypothetical protein [Gammaproteobacteria bacterium]
MFPNGDMDCILAANDCRNVAKPVDPPVPPRSVINVLKLVCSDVSAAPAAVPAVVAAVLVSVDVPAIVWIKLCTLVAKCPPGPLLWVDAVPAAAVVLSALELVAVSDCAWSAAIKSFKKFCSACPTSVLGVVLGVDAVELVAAAALDVVDASVTPTDDRAPSIAATKPPGGGGAPDDAESSLDVVLFCCASSADSVEGELVDPELVTELTLICCS